MPAQQPYTEVFYDQFRVGFYLCSLCNRILANSKAAVWNNQLLLWLSVVEHSSSVRIDQLVEALNR